MINLKSIFKEIIQTKLQVIIFIFCLILAIGTFVSIDSLKYNVQSFVETDSKIINGGDVIINSNRVYSENLSEGLIEIKDKYPEVIFMNSYSFSSLVYSPEADSSILSQIRVVSETYPLYGEAQLESGRDIKDVFEDQNNIIVEKNLLTRLGINIGSKIKVGEKIFTIADVILVEPDQPLSLFNIGPRIIISEVNLNELNLVGEKSRVNYKTLIKTFNEDDTLEIVDFLSTKISQRESVNSYFDENNGLKQFVLNFLFFIKMISLFIVIITGIGITSIIFSYLDEKKLSIGIRKSLGEKNNQILIYYFISILIISLIGILFAILFAYLLMNIFPNVFTDILPEDVKVSLSMISIVKG
ncbi:MAG: FtsX-like permease family protein, partial [Nanoarchaeota archaeon]|nr:FtsX-like permease family protein [Nanoarchaeota archaeon]